MNTKLSRAYFAMGALALASAGSWGCVADRPARNGVFNENVQKLQDTIDNAAGDLNGLRPPGAEAQAANKQLVHAYGDLADEFDKVKEARRESYPKAIVALTAVQRSEPARQSIRAAMQLRRLGFKVPVSATIGSGA